MNTEGKKKRKGKRKGKKGKEKGNRPMRLASSSTLLLPEYAQEGKERGEEWHRVSAQSHPESQGRHKGEKGGRERGREKGRGREGEGNGDVGSIRLSSYSCFLPASSRRKKGTPERREKKKKRGENTALARSSPFTRLIRLRKEDEEKRKEGRKIPGDPRNPFPLSLPPAKRRGRKGKTRPKHAPSSP